MKAYDLNNAAEHLAENGTAAFLTSGTSMRPLFRTHKDIIVISRAIEPLKKYDVALYKKSGVNRLILHRVIGINPDGTYIIRGDNTYRKEYIPAHDVVGVMTAFYRGGKYVDPKASKTYFVYVRLNQFFYPVRHIYYVNIRPVLSKIKRKIIKGK